MMQDDTMSVSSGISEKTNLAPDDIAARYEKLSGVREGLLERARGHAALTIPALFPESGLTEDAALLTPFQSIGARGVNNLANKLLLTLFPVSSPFFKFEIPEGIIQQLQESDPNIKEELESKLSEMENIIQSDLETNAFRPKIYEALLQLIVVGDYLLYVPPTGEPSGYRLDKYVVKRSVQGIPLEIILKEVMSKEELPSEWYEQLKNEDKLESHRTGDEPNRTGDMRDGKYHIYTRIHLQDDMFHEAKYIHGVLLRGSEGKYPKESSAWLALRWRAQEGEDYGRSYVDNYRGALIAAEGLSRSIQEHSAIASKTFGILRPNSNMSPKDIANVPNGGIIVGEPEDLVFPEVSKRQDMQVTMDSYHALVEELGKAFMLTQVRDSERTTAEEIRLMASELETSLGGAYSLFGITFQKPLLMREIHRLQNDRNSLLPKISKEDLQPKVVVGLEGLGRGTDLEKLMRAIGAIGQLAPVAQNIPQMDMAKVVQFVFNSVGLDSDEVLKSQKQMQQEQAAAQQQKASEMAGEAISKGIGGSIPKMAEAAIDNPEALKEVMNNMGGLAGGSGGPPLPEGVA